MMTSKSPRRKSLAKETAETVEAAKAAQSTQPSFDFNSPQEIVCGVDEAGRGPLAGPVVAAAVILDPKRRIVGLNDSKVLSAKMRETLFEKIVGRALAYCVASASVEEIDQINILQATMLAMRRAVEGLAITPTLVKVDGNRCPVISVRSEAIIGGDARVACISAASILAKVTRDRMLQGLHLDFPMYGFDSHVGYGTRQHLAALFEHGPCEHHRRSFAPVREALANRELRVRLPGDRPVLLPGASDDAFSDPFGDEPAH